MSYEFCTIQEIHHFSGSIRNQYSKLLNSNEFTNSSSTV